MNDVATVARVFHEKYLGQFFLLSSTHTEQFNLTLESARLSGPLWQEWLQL